MDVLDDIISEIDGGGESHPSGFVTYDWNTGARGDGSVTRADLRKLEHRLLRAIDGSRAGDTDEKPQDAPEQHDDPEERAQWRKKALQWRKNGAA